jgi:hypothetical protein
VGTKAHVRGKREVTPVCANQVLQVSECYSFLNVFDSGVTYLLILDFMHHLLNVF